MSDAKFPRGIFFKKPREGAPSFIKGQLSFRVEEAIAYLREFQNNGWVNVDIKLSKDGKLYLQLNEWKPKETTGSSEELPPEAESIF